MIMNPDLAAHARTVQPPAAQTPFDTLTEAFGGLMVGHCLTTVANFKVADALGDTPRTATELAADTGADPEGLRRMLRLLAAHGVFACSEDRFAHTAASQLLRADHPHSMRDFVTIYGTPTVEEHLAYFDYVLQTGRIVAEGTGAELLKSDLVRQAYLGASGLAS